MEELNDIHLDALIDHLNRNVTISLDIHAQFKTVKSKRKEHEPWYTNELAELKHKARRMENTWHKYCEEHEWKVYKLEHNYYNFKLKCTKREFMTVFWTARTIQAGQ